MEFIHHILSQEKNTQKTALVFPQSAVTLTYAELFEQCVQLSHAFQSQAVLPGSRIVILLPNSPEFIIALFAIMKVGGVAIPLDTFAKKSEILDILNLINPRLIVTNQSLSRKIRRDLSVNTRICFLNFSTEKLGIWYHFTEFHAVMPSKSISDKGKNPKDDLHFSTITPRNDALFIMTSGSTGIPKAVRLSHESVLCNMRMHLNSLRIDSDIIGLQVLPMNYSYGLIASFLSILYSQGTVIFTTDLQAKLIIQHINRFKVNLLVGTPTFFRYIFDKVSIKNSDTHARESAVPDEQKIYLSMDSLRYITLGGDKCPPNLLNLIRKKLSNVRVYVTYGLTEAGPRVSTLPPEYLSTHPHSIGIPLNGIEVKIIKEHGEICLPYEMGEIVVRTPSIMNGYFGTEEKTAKVLQGGWFYTGDLGWTDKEGFLYFGGRKDMTFKINGKKINPSLIEDYICSHPSIETCCIHKVKEDTIEYIRATIKLTEITSDTLIDELKRICRQKLPAYMIPKDFTLDDQHYYFKGQVDQSLQIPQADRKL